MPSAAAAVAAAAAAAASAAVTTVVAASGSTMSVGLLTRASSAPLTAQSVGLSKNSFALLVKSNALLAAAPPGTRYTVRHHRDAMPQVHGVVAVPGVGVAVAPAPVVDTRASQVALLRERMRQHVQQTQRAPALPVVMATLLETPATSSSSSSSSSAAVAGATLQRAVSAPAAVGAGAEALRL